MHLGHPAHSLALALDDATRMRLLGVPSDLATSLFGMSGGAPRTRRPSADECEVLLFRQTWRAADVGYADGGDEPLEGFTIVITGPMGDACVYCCTQFAYHVREPNRRFFLDAAAQLMAGRGDAAGYEESCTHGDGQLDYSLEVELARWHATLAHTRPAQLEVLSRRLHALADGLAAGEARTWPCEPVPLAAA